VERLGTGAGIGLSDKTVRSYLDILTGTFMVRQLLPSALNPFDVLKQETFLAPGHRSGKSLVEEIGGIL
jgi:hypothetical protein